MVGFDNWEVMANGARPPLTTVDLNLLKLGRHAATKLLAAIDGEDVRGTEKYPCELVVRQSTGVASREASPAGKRHRSAVTASKARAAD